MGTGPTNSSAPTTSVLVGGVYNATLPVVLDTQGVALQTDVNGNLKTTSSGGTTTISGNVTVVQSTGTNLHVVTDTGSTTAITGDPAVQRGLQDSAVGSGRTTTVTAGTVVVPAFTPGTAGVWEIYVTATVGFGGVAVDAANMNLNKTGVAYTLLANPAPGSATFGPYRVTLLNTDTLSVTIVATGTSTIPYAASVTATRIG